MEDLGRFLAIFPGTFWNLISHLHQNPLDLISFQPRNPPEPCQLSAPEPSRTHRDLISCPPGNSPEPHQPSAPEPAGTSSAICPETLRNLISHLPRNSPEPHQPSAPEPSGTLRNPPEPSGTLRNLLRNLVLQLHRIAPELFWAKDPIASLAVGEKTDIPGVWFIQNHPHKLWMSASTRAGLCWAWCRGGPQRLSSRKGQDDELFWISPKLGPTGLFLDELLVSHVFQFLSFRFGMLNRGFGHHLEASERSKVDPHWPQPALVRRGATRRKRFGPTWGLRRSPATMTYVVPSIFVEVVKLQGDC